MKTFDFKPWPKTPRAKTNNITITEKMDGTNACVVVQDGKFLGCQSRNRIITPENDNMGFADWAYENKGGLVGLGDGYHYGEWVGPGIQKNPHKLPQKEFFLFNTLRPQGNLPDRVKLVREFYTGLFSQEVVDYYYTLLWEESVKGPNPYSPEGIIVYYHLSKTRMKYTYANQDGKWVNTEDYEVE